MEHRLKRRFYGMERGAHEFIKNNLKSAQFAPLQYSRNAQVG